MRAAVGALAVVAALVCAGAAADPGRAPMADPALVQDLAQHADAVAILVAQPGSLPGVMARVQALGLEAHAWPRLEMAAVRLSAQDLARVAAIPGVVSWSANERMHAYLDRSADYIGASIVWQQFDETGDGVTVMIVDTGIDGSHPDVRYGDNLLENVMPTRSGSGLIGGFAEGVVASDSSGHGTHVAGTVAGLGRAAGPGTPDAGRFLGIAHGAKLVGFAAGLPTPGDEDPVFDSTTVLEAYEYTLSNRERWGIEVVSNSWGADGAFAPTSPVNLATRQLYLEGLVVTFAAGNEGDQGEGTLNRYCGAPWVLCVGAGDYLNQRASFSSIGTDAAESGRAYDHPDLLAPGVGITAAKSTTDGAGTAGGLTGGLVPARSGPLYVSKSGTSMATPHASGVAALLLSANPQLSPDQVYDILVGTSTPLPGHDVWTSGAGYLNALDAFRLARSTPGDRAAFLDGQVKYAGALVGDPDHALDPVSVGLGGTATGFHEDVSLPGLAQDLVGTTQGLTFVLGSALLTLAAFGTQRTRRGGA